jgi:hypothetical protein
MLLTNFISDPPQNSQCSHDGWVKGKGSPLELGATMAATTGEGFPHFPYSAAFRARGVGEGGRVAGWGTGVLTLSAG